MLSIIWSVFLLNFLKELSALYNKFEKKSSQNTHMYCRLWITRALSKKVKFFKTVYQKIREKMNCTKDINLQIDFFLDFKGYKLVDTIFFFNSEANLVLSFNKPF